ncbi:L-azetidine-2-carboxylic acid acetyltransferase [Yarrowia sp. C11]|nr:L-azetidine-2-carboxylic acid acetyltransferase [Yarrowia sp. E02]KAG5371765.1 L-azetidine-2-carboxylic acid acetyltransferase [Yarrowia sp. C11]
MNCVEQPSARVSELLHVTLKDGSEAVIVPINGYEEAAQKLPQSLIEFMFSDFNREIEDGQTYPQLKPLADSAEFVKYWFIGWVGLLVRGSELPTGDSVDWSETLLGNYYIKPNYPGRCSHNCNAGFMVNPRHRGLGVGKTLGRSYLYVGPRLGYTYSVFNLVFKTNVASCRIWDSLGFDVVGKIPGAAILKGFDEPIDALIYGRKLDVKETDTWRL